MFIVAMVVKEAMVVVKPLNVHSCNGGERSDGALVVMVRTRIVVIIEMVTMVRQQMVMVIVVTGKLVMMMMIMRNAGNDYRGSRGRGRG